MTQNFAYFFREFSSWIQKKFVSIPYFEFVPYTLHRRYLQKKTQSFSESLDCTQCAIIRREKKQPAILKQFSRRKNTAIFPRREDVHPAEEEPSSSRHDFQRRQPNLNAGETNRLIYTNKETSAVRRERKESKEWDEIRGVTASNSCEVATERGSFSVATTSSCRALPLTNCIDDKSPRVSSVFPAKSETRVSTPRWRESWPPGGAVASS